MLQLIVLGEAAREGTHLAATRGAILDLTRRRDVVEREWSGASAALARALGWVEEQGARPPKLPQEPVVVSLAAFFYTPGVDRWLRTTAGAHGQLEKWYFSKVLQPASRSASNYNIGKDYAELLAWYQGAKPLAMMEVRLDAAALTTLAPSDVRYRVLFALMVREVREDMRTQAGLGTDDPVEDHHVFPRSFATRHGLELRKLNGLANRIPVSKATNRHLSDRPPEEYFREILTKSPSGKIEGLLERAGFEAVRGGTEGFLATLSPDNFDRFVTQRAERLLDIVQRSLNGLLVRSTMDEETDD